MPNPEIECSRCCGNGEIVTDWERYKHPHPDDEGDEAVADCPDCDGRGWRPMTDEERDDAAADAFSDLCEGEPPITMDERHAMAWRENQGLR